MISYSCRQPLNGLAHNCRIGAPGRKETRACLAVRSSAPGLFGQAGAAGIVECRRLGRSGLRPNPSLRTGCLLHPGAGRDPERAASGPRIWGFATNRGSRNCLAGRRDAPALIGRANIVLRGGARAGRKQHSTGSGPSPPGTHLSTTVRHWEKLFCRRLCLLVTRKRKAVGDFRCPQVVCNLSAVVRNGLCRPS